MTARLEGKVAIVTGAGSQTDGIGNGRAAAILFAREGARVLLVDRKRDRAEETLHRSKPKASPITLPSSRPTSPTSEQCRAMVADAVARWGKLDILQNNVGIGARAGTILDMDDAVWDRMMRVNVTGMMLAAKAAIPAMKENGGGAIVNISSVANWRPRGLAAYATSKGAVEALTRGLAADHGRDKHPRELHRARPRLHADGAGRRYVRPRSRRPPRGDRPRHRRHRLGHRLGLGVPGRRMKPATSPASCCRSTAACCSRRGSRDAFVL